MDIQRINWIDWAKSLCIFLMVCGHSHATAYVHDFLYLFHMPVFFIISGLLYKPKKIKYLCTSLLVPVIIWNLINYPWYYYRLIKEQIDLSFNSLFLQPFLGLFIHDFEIGIPVCGVFWFVMVIFILRVFQQTISDFKPLQYASIIICVLIAYFSNETPQKGVLFLFQRAAIAYPFYYLGIYLKNHPKLLNCINDYKRPLSFVTLGILIIFPLIAGSFDLYSCQLNIFPSYYIIGIIGFIFIYLFTNFISSRIGTPIFIRNISNGTLVILGLHTLVLFTLSKLSNHTDFPMRGELFSILTMMILYLPTVYIIKKIPILIGKKK